MKLQFKSVFRVYVAICLMTLGWCFWSSAQTGDAPPTNHAAAVPAPDEVKVKTKVSLPAEEEYVLTFGLDEIKVLNDIKPFGNPLYKYLASLIYILLAFYVSKFLDFFIHNRLKKWAGKRNTLLDDLLLDVVHGPIKVIAFVIFLHVGLRVLVWPPWVEEFLSKGLKLVVAWSLTYMSLRFVDLLMSYWKQRAAAEDDKSIDEQLFPIIRKSLKVFVIIVAVLATSQNLGLNITSVLASLSIGGLALGLAAQDTLANLFGAVAVFLDKPFRVGDRIILDTTDGVVETIGLRSTRVRNQDGHLVTIPNKTMGNATIINVSRRPNIKTVVNLGVTYDTSAEMVQRALDILDEVYRKHPMTQDVWISFNKFADSALNIQVIHWWKTTDYQAYLKGMQEMNLAIKKRFDAEGIEFAFPTQTLHVKSVPRGTPPLVQPGDAT